MPGKAGAPVELGDSLSRSGTQVKQSLECQMWLKPLGRTRKQRRSVLSNALLTSRCDGYPDVTTARDTFVILSSTGAIAIIRATGFGEMSSPAHRRRWARQISDLPVRVIHRKQNDEIVVSGRGTEISEGGMALYAGISVEPGDMMEIEFQMPQRKRVSAVVRNRSGYYFGLEFLSPLETEDAKPTNSNLASSYAPRRSEAYQLLQRKEMEVQRLRREIQALRKLVPSSF